MKLFYATTYISKQKPPGGVRPGGTSERSEKNLIENEGGRNLLFDYLPVVGENVGL